MAASYLLSSSLVPVLSTWILAPTPLTTKRCTSLREVARKLGRFLEKLTETPDSCFALRGYGAGSHRHGRAVSRKRIPQVSSGQLCCAFRAPIGSRVEATERLSLDVPARSKRPLARVM